MSQTKQQVQLSKFMSYALRHGADKLGLAITADGKVNIDELVKCHNAQSPNKVTKEDVLGVVATCEKQRYSVDAYEVAIWANQGHSMKDVHADLEQLEPPPYLYHGTATRNYESIMAEGLVPKSRQHVHLSADFETAMVVGARHGKPQALKIDSQRMHQDGTPFWKSANGVWLCKYVDPKYIFKPIKENA